MKLFLPFLLTLLTIVACVSSPAVAPEITRANSWPTVIPSILPIPGYSNNPPPGTQRPTETLSQKKKISFNYLFEDSDKNTTTYIWNLVFSEATSMWNDALEYEVFKESKENVNLRIKYVSELYIKNGVKIAGTCRSDCEFAEIKVFMGATFKKGTALHELGHAIGLKHSELEEEVMFPMIDKEKYLTFGDIIKAKKAVENCYD